MADVVSIWSRARRDRAYRELLLRDPGTALAGLDLSDDELAMLDLAIRALEPVPIPNVFELPGGSSQPTTGPEPTTDRAPAQRRSAERQPVEPHPSTPLHPERKDPR